MFLTRVYKNISSNNTEKLHRLVRYELYEITSINRP